MIVIPGKVISAKCVLNRFNPGIKFLLQLITSFRVKMRNLVSRARVVVRISFDTLIPAACASQLSTPRSTNHSNDLWRCPSRCLCRRPLLNCQLLAKGELRDYLHLNTSSMPLSGSLLLDQPLIKLLFPKQWYTPANSSRYGTWRVVFTWKIPFSSKATTSV